MSAPDRRSPFAEWSGRVGGADAGDPLSITELFSDFVQISARKGRQADLAAALKTRLGLDLPPPGGSSAAAGYVALWTQPSSWLLRAPLHEAAGLTKAMAAEFADLIAVVDQSHGRCVLRLSGRHARDVLARCCRLDLHPRVFGVGASAVTLVGHVACVVHKIDATPTYDVIVGSTFSVWLLDQLVAAADGFGWRFERAGTAP